MSDFPSVLIPHQRQWLVITCPCDEILYGGAAGAGKSFCLLFDWTAHEAKYEGAAKGLLLRRSYPELQDIIREAKNLFNQLPNPPKWVESKNSFFYSSGAILEFGYLDGYDDVFRYQGRQFNWRGNDELTQWATPDEYEYLNTRMRSVDGVKVRIISTTNPGGKGHNWVMNRWGIDTHPSGMRPIETKLKVSDDKEITWRRIFIPGKLEDNPSLDSDGQYRAQLMMKGDTLRKMLLEGRWDVVDGAFFHEWNPEIHVIRAFVPPKSWKRWFALDWGSAKPYAGLWFAESPNGEVFVYRETYGWGGKPNKGTYENASQVAQKIRKIEQESSEWVVERYLDGSSFSRDGHEITIADLFAKEGVNFQPSIKKNKVAGIENFREYLKIVNGVSRLKVMDNCIHFIRTIPTLQTDRNQPDQYDSDGEDHMADAALYGLRRRTPDMSEIKAQNTHYAKQAARYARMGEFGIV